MIGINNLFTFKLRLSGTICAWVVLLLISGCGESPSAIEDPEVPLQSIRVDGEIELNGGISWDASIDSVSAKLWATNIGSESGGIQYGPCSFQLLAYQSDKKEEKPVWYNKLPEKSICFDVLEQIILGPDESKEIINLGNVAGKNWAFDLPDGNLSFVVKVKRKDGNMLSFPLTSASL